MIWIIYAIIIASLMFATYHDVKTKEIPIFIFPLMGIACAILNGIRIYNHPDNWKIEIILLAAGAILYGLASAFLMFKKHMGGADVYMFIFTGLSLGFNAMTESVIMACIAGLIILLVNKAKGLKQKEYPFAPMLLIGVLGDLVLRIILLLTL